MCGSSSELHWRTFLDNTKADECVHCRAVGAEIRLHLHIAFIWFPCFQKLQLRTMLFLHRLSYLVFEDFCGNMKAV